MFRALALRQSEKLEILYSDQFTVANLRYQLC